MQKLIVTRATAFKQLPKDSSKLKPAQVVNVAIGTTYALAAHQRAPGQHIRVTFARDEDGAQPSLNGRNTWYVFAPHVQFSPSLAAAESVRRPFDEQAAIDWNNPNCKVSRYFTVREVTNGCRRRIPKSSSVLANVLALAKELDQLREAWGSPIGVTSWHRPPAINRAVGGVSNSQHINGSAVDVYTMDGRDLEFEEWLDRRWPYALGYGVGSGRGFTHLDMRPGKIRWWY